jgi:hypothetical protein
MTRVTALRKIGGYGAAAAVAPYLVVKIAWTFGLFLPNMRMGEPGWRAINATTAVLALAGMLLGLAFCQPWGERVPAWLVVVPIWIGTGLLVPMVLVAPVLAPAAMTRDRAAGGTATWSIEQILVVVSLVGAGIGLPLALAGYVKARWPEALAGRITLRPNDLRTTLARLIAVGAGLLGAVKIFWAAGGTLGIDPARLPARDLWWHLLSLSTGAWSLAGACTVLALTSGRFRPSLLVSWVSSGMLFSYNLFFALRTDSQASPEFPVPRVLCTEAGIVLGLLMVVVVLLVVDDRGRAGEESLNRLPENGIHTPV